MQNLKRYKNEVKKQMISKNECKEILHDLSMLQLSRQKDPNYILSDDKINTIAAKVKNLVQNIKIGHNKDTRLVFDNLVYPLAKEIIRQNIQDLDDLLASASHSHKKMKSDEPSLKEQLNSKKDWFAHSTKSAWELFAAVLGIKTVPNKTRNKLFRYLTRIWDEYSEQK